ncbi:MAG: helix-turn-helix domain-containing protein [Alistipes sp.]|nr:helix-turn-helix domain-containing protein [Bacteroidales bacterium]MBR5492490.1 helix-turn-helix domain-containing protein [Alistipes sp.]MBR5920060.1 helix-turn-helix domain-containing protein [Bacteroidales bacterium]
MEVNKQVGHTLADLRQHQGLTIEAAATATDTTPDKLADIERGYIPHNVHNLARIVEAMQGRLAIVPEETEQDPHCQFIKFE